MMKKYIYSAFAVIMLLFAGCGKEKTTKEDGFSIEGSWELVSVQTKSAVVGNRTVDVYVVFESGKFTVFQRLGGDRFVAFTGTYTFSGGVLSGRYSDGSSLGSSYSVEGKGDSMTLTTAGGAESDRYSRISSVPESVISSVI